jgi:hypothetical protein
MEIETRRCAEHDLAHWHYIVLADVQEHPDTSQQQLARRIVRSPSRLATDVEDLCSRGLLRRASAEHDRRINHTTGSPAHPHRRGAPTSAAGCHGKGTVARPTGARTRPGDPVKRGARIQRIAWTSGPCVQPLLPPSPGLRKRIAATQDGGTRRGTEAGTTRHPCVQAQSPRSTCPGRRETLATRSARGNRHWSRPGLAGPGDHSHLVRPAGDRSSDRIRLSRRGSRPIVCARAA